MLVGEGSRRGSLPVFKRSTACGVLIGGGRQSCWIFSKFLIPKSWHDGLALELRASLAVGCTRRTSSTYQHFGCEVGARELHQ